MRLIASDASDETTTMRHVRLSTVLWCAASVAAIAIVWSGRTHADALPGRYAVKTGTVYDTKTRLTWQQSVAPSTYSESDASQYCATLSLKGATWRLPTIKELATLTDESRFDPAIDPSAFPDTPPKPFWTSSIVAGFAQYAWTVDFSHGGDNFFDVSLEQLVRCVH